MTIPYVQAPNSVEAFVNELRERFPDIIEQMGEYQTSDEELVMWKGMEAGFRVHLSNGASFNIVVSQHDQADPDKIDGAFRWNELEETYTCPECDTVHYGDDDDDTFCSTLIPVTDEGERYEDDGRSHWDGYYQCQVCGHIAMGEEHP